MVHLLAASEIVASGAGFNVDIDVCKPGQVTWVQYINAAAVVLACMLKADWVSVVEP